MIQILQGFLLLSVLSILEIDLSCTFKQHCMNKRYISNLLYLVVIFPGGPSLALVESYKVLCCLHKLCTIAVVQRRRNKRPRVFKQGFQNLLVASVSIGSNRLRYSDLHKSVVVCIQQTSYMLDTSCQL